MTHDISSLLATEGQVPASNGFSVSCAGNNYKLLLNDQNEFGVLDTIEWKMKYTELIDNVYVWNEMIECVGFSMEEVETIIEDICLN